MQCIDRMNLDGKKLLVRVDYNVPLEGGRITDDNRIRASLPTLNYALEHGAALIICAHLGKPKGVDPALTLAPAAQRLGELLGRPVVLAPDCVGPEVRALCAGLKPGGVVMLENLRFHKEETGKTPADRGDFGKQLADLADIYVSDAFGVAHRPNASVVDAPHAAKACCVGFLMHKEWKYLGEALADPKHPFTALSGGAKVSTKVGILKNLLGKVDHLVIGGAMANTFLEAKGLNVGASLVEEEQVAVAREILDTAQAKKTQIHLPVDLVLGSGVKDAKPLGVVDADKVPDGAMILDIGPKSVAEFTRVLDQSATIVWNGPVGLFENPAFAQGTLALCRALAANRKSLVIVGGGDTDAVVHQAGLADKFDFISTGGGSFLEFLEGKELPGIQALKECA